VKIPSRLKKIVNTAFFRGLGAGSMLLVFALVARLYDKQDAAHLFFLVSLSTALTPVLLFGTNFLAVRQLPTLSEAADGGEAFMRAVLRNFILTRGGLAILVCGGLAIAHWAMALDVSLILAAIAIIFLAPLTATIGFLFQGLQRYNLSISILYIINMAMIATLVVITQVMEPGIDRGKSATNLLFFLASLATLIVAALILWMVRRISLISSLAKTESSLDMGPQRPMLIQFGIVACLVSAGTWVAPLAFYISADQESFATFSVSERLANIINFFAVIGNFFLAPVVAQLGDKVDVQGIKTEFVRMVRFMTLAALPVIIVIVGFPHLPLKLFGDQYANATGFLVIMTCAQFFNVMTGSVNTILNMTGYVKPLIWTLVGGLIAAIACLVILVPTIGPLGYAIAYAAAIVVQNGTASIVMYRAYGFSVLDALLPAKRTN
jgi:O-antigen/teichoic acid export membrane protein